MLFILFMSLQQRLTTAFGSFVMYVVLGLVLVLVFALQWANTRRQRPKLVAGILEEGLCPSCGYSLEHLPVEDDGCLVCAECGSAWRRNRIERFISVHRVGPAARAGPMKRFFGGGHRAYDVKDDRGNVRAVLSVEQLGKLARRDGDGPADRARRVAYQEVRYLGLPLRVVLAVIVGGIYGIFAVVVLTTTWRPVVGPPGVGAATNMFLSMLIVAFHLFIAVFFPLVIVRSRLGRSARRVCWEVQSFGLCGSCGYGLRGRAPEGDGCTVCPECGAAWRLEGKLVQR